VLGLGHSSIISIAFTSARNGWASEGPADGAPGEVLRTNDGGTSWRPQRVGALQIQEVGAAGGEGYALDLMGDLFATRTDGDLGGASSISLKAPRKASRGGRVCVMGRLVPSLTGALFEICYRALAGGLWAHRVVTVDGGGKFSLTVRIRRATAFVAQSAGDVSTRGAARRR
jgi:hypothetical protein